MKQVLIIALIFMAFPTFAFAQNAAGSCTDHNGFSHAPSFLELTSTEYADIEETCNGTSANGGHIASWESNKNIFPYFTFKCTSLILDGADQELIDLYCSYTHIAVWKAKCCPASDTFGVVGPSL